MAVAVAEVGARASAKPAGPVVLTTPQGPETLVAGQTHKVVAEPGRQYKLTRATGSADNVIATRQGADLLLRYEDGTSVLLQGFYKPGQGAMVASVLLPADGTEGYLLKGDSTGGVSDAEGSVLVYAHGARDTLLEMAKGQGTLSDVFTTSGEGATLTYLPTSSASAVTAMPGSDFNPASLIGLLGIGAIAASGGGGGSSSAAGAGAGGGGSGQQLPVTPTVTTTTTTINGVVVAGPVIAGNDLMIRAYTAGGTLLASTLTVGANGQYTLSYTANYVGVVLLKLSSGGGALDYLDEAIHSGKDLNSNLFAIVTVSFLGQSLSANITPLTTLGAYKVGLNSTQDAIIGDSSVAAVAASNNLVAKLFGLTTGNDQIVDLEATPVVSSTGTTQVGNLYGKLLAAISGTELALGQTTEQVMVTLGAGMTLSAGGPAFSNDAAGNAAKGALAQGLAHSIQAGALVTADALQLITNLFINADPAVAPQVIIFGDALRLNAAGNVGGHAATARLYFKLSAPSVDFVGADITVAGGTLGALTVDASDPTLYSAIFTPSASDALAAQITVNAGTFSNASGITNVAAVPFTMVGDTQAPAAPVVSGTANGALNDGLLSGSEQLISLHVNLPTGGAAAHEGDSVAVLVNGAALTPPVAHILTASDITAGFVDLSVTRLSLGSDGAKTLSTNITDAAGNVSANASGSFKLDTAVAASTVVLTTDSGVSASDQITNVAAFTVGSLEVVSAGASGFSYLQYQVDVNTGAWTTGALGATSVSSSAFAGAADGAHTLFVRQVDLAGNVSAVTTQTFTLDATAPGAPTLALTTDSGSNPSDNISNTGALSVSALEATSAGASGFEHLEYQIGSTGGSWLSGPTGVTSLTSAMLSGLVQGSNTVYVRQVDQAGNVSGIASKVFTLDTVAPLLTISGVGFSADTGTSATDHTTTTAAQTITATLSAVLTTGDVLEGSLNNGTSWTPITSMVSGTTISWTGATLAGSTNIEFRVTDVAGNVAAATGTTAYVLDITAPAQTVSAVALSADTGTSAADHNTKTATQTITATLSAALTTGDIVEGSLDNGTTWINVTSMVSGTTISWASATLVGSSSIEFRVTDLAGNVAIATGVTAYVLDTTAPVLTVSAVALSADTGTNATDHITKTAAQTITATLSAALTTGDIVEGSLDNGTTWINVTSMVTGTAISWANATLVGNSNIVFRVTDLAGNNGSPSGTTAYVLDTTPSALTVSAVTLSADTGTSTTDHNTKTAAQTITATLSAALTTGEVLEGSLDNGTTWTPITGMVSGTTITWTGATLAGSSSIEFRITDVAGNVAAATGTTAYVLDITAPAQTVSAVALSADTGTSTTDHNTKTAAQTITATLSAALTTGDVLEGSLDNGSTWTPLTSMVSGTTITWTGVTLAGSSNIAFRVTDLAGNVGSPSGVTAYVLDTTAPVPSVTAVAFSADTGISGTDHLTKTAAQTITATLGASLATGDVLEGSLNNGGSWVPITNMVSGTAISWTGATLVGSSSVVFRVTDLAGNVSANTGATSYILDSSAPVVSSVTVSGSNGAATLVAGDHVLVSAVMSEAVDVTGIPTYGITLDSGAHLASYVSGTGTNTLVFSYTVAAGDSDLSGGVTASVGALLASGANAIADHAGNLADLTVAAIAASANTVHVDTSAPTVQNAAVLDGTTNLEVTSNLILNFGTAINVATAGTINLVNDANSGTKLGFAGENLDHSVAMHFGTGTISAGVTTMETYSSATTQDASTLNGSLSIVNATGVVTISPLFDLDLSNNYHLEIAASSFTGTSNGLGNAAFGALTGGAYALNFSTVSIGAASATGVGNASVEMTSATALTTGHTWINITGLGDTTNGTVATVASATGATAYVIANQTVDPADTVITSDTTSVLLAPFRTSDFLYVDNTINGRISDLSSGSQDLTWTAGNNNDTIKMSLTQFAAYPANISISTGAYLPADFNQRVDLLVSSGQVVIG